MKKFVSVCLSFVLLTALMPWGMGVDLTESPDITEIVPKVGLTPSAESVLEEETPGVTEIDIENEPLETAEIEVEQEQFEQAYQNVMTYAEEHNIPLEMVLEEFVDEYYHNYSYQNIESYENAYYELLDTGELGACADVGVEDDEVGSAGGKWYYNTGTSLPQTANYNTYNLLSTVEKGDIIFESQGGFGITGHIAIVEGKYYSAAKKQFYIRLIEAVKPDSMAQGLVCRGVLDDQRVNEKGVSVLRVTNASNAQKNNAVAFCRSQLGKQYALDVPAKDHDANQADWYCSELVWAAYYNQGINIETTDTVNQPGITPLDIQACDKLTNCGFRGTRPENVLQDISGHWANEYIKYAVKNGLMAGTSTTTFEPDAAVTRATPVTVLYKMENRPTVGSNPFSDVPRGQWYTDAITWANDNGIAAGISSTTFGPNNILNREQAAVIMYHYAGYKGYNTAYSTTSLNGFTDKANVSSYAVNAMRWAVSRGVMSGTSSTTLSPQATVTRAQLAAMFKLMMEKTAR